MYLGKIPLTYRQRLNLLNMSKKRLKRFHEIEESLKVFGNKDLSIMYHNYIKEAEASKWRRVPKYNSYEIKMVQQTEEKVKKMLDMLFG